MLPYQVNFVPKIETIKAVTNIEEIALAAEKGGADAVSAVNTFVGMAIDYKTGKILLSTKFGGLSGPAIKPIALANVHKIYKEVKKKSEKSHTFFWFEKKQKENQINHTHFFLI